MVYLWYFFFFGFILLLKNFCFVWICYLLGEKVESGEDLEYDEFVEGVGDLFWVLEGKLIKLKWRKKKKMEDENENEELKILVYE